LNPLDRASFAWRIIGLAPKFQEKISTQHAALNPPSKDGADSLRGKKIENHHLRILEKAILATRPQRGTLLETRNPQQVLTLFLATRNSHTAHS